MCSEVINLFNPLGAAFFIFSFIVLMMIAILTARNLLSVFSGCLCIVFFRMSKIISAPIKKDKIEEMNHLEVVDFIKMELFFTYFSGGVSILFLAFLFYSEIVGINNLHQRYMKAASVMLVKKRILISLICIIISASAPWMSVLSIRLVTG